jgi:L-amino acid N-acyltransferase YncA
MNAPAIFRTATTGDAPSILEIYRPYIERSATSFEEQVPALDSFAARIEKGLERYPWLVCEVDGVVAGYAYAAVYNERAAYQWTCLCSVYIAEDYRGRGLAKSLYNTLFSLLRAQGFCTVFALITLPNDASVKLHERCGFKPFTIFENIGFKLGSWQRVGWWRLELGAYPADPPAVVAFPDLPVEIRNGILTDAATKNR